VPQQVSVIRAPTGDGGDGMDQVIWKAVESPLLYVHV
jgi:hypothetical protein